MQFIFDGEIYKVVRVTGPAHNMLGLSIVENGSFNNNVEVVSLKIKNDDVISISESDVKEQVLSAMSEINIKFKVNYKVTKILFVPSDTAIKNIYRELATELISRVIMNGEFLRP